MGVGFAAILVGWAAGWHRVRNSVNHYYDVGYHEPQHYTRLPKISFLFVALLCLVGGCGFNEMIYRASHSAFFSMSPAERDAAWSQYSLSQQLDLYLEAMKFEPPDAFGLTRKVASNGTKMVPIIVQRLEKGRSGDREALFELLIVISSDYCDLGGDPQLMAKLELLAGSIRDERDREKAEESVEKIAIRNYPVSYQLTLLLGSNDGLGDWDVVTPVASHGIAIVPLALARLKDTKTDEARLLIFDFLWFVSMEDCRVSKDTAMFTILRQTADSMEDSDARRRAYIWIEKIQSDCIHPKVAAAKSPCS